jgi:hypothetical protein
MTKKIVLIFQDETIYVLFNIFLVTSIITLILTLCCSQIENKIKNPNIQSILILSVFIFWGILFIEIWFLISNILIILLS